MWSFVGRHRLSVATLALALVSNLATPALAFDPDIRSRPANPFSLPVEADEGRLAYQEIGRDGGTVSTTGADGTAYSLNIPRGALSRNVYISIAPIKAGSKTPKDMGRILGVTMAPEGLTFYRPATLTIRPKGAFASANNAAFSLSGKGEQASLTLMTRSGSGIEIPVMHFSGTAVSEDVSIAKLRSLFGSTPIPELERLIHAMAVVRESARREGKDQEAAVSTYMQEQGMYTAFSLLSQLVAGIELSKHGGGPVQACFAAGKAVSWTPILNMMMMAASAKIIGGAGHEMTAAQVGEIVKTIKMDDAQVLSNTKFIGDLAERCIDYAASNCASYGDYKSLVDIYRIFGEIKNAVREAIHHSDEDEKPSNSSMQKLEEVLFLPGEHAKLLESVMGQLDPKLQPTAEKLISWLKAYDLAGDPRQLQDKTLGYLKQCAKYKVTWKSDATRSQLEPGNAWGEERFAGLFEGDLEFVPGLDGDPILNGQVRGVALAEYPVAYVKLIKPTNFLSQRIVSPLRIEGPFQMEIVKMEIGEKGKLELRGEEPVVFYDREICFKFTPCRRDQTIGSILSIIYERAGKTVMGMMQVTELKPANLPPLLFEGEVKTEPHDGVGEAKYVDVSRISVVHTGKGDTKLATEQIWTTIRQMICKEIRGGGTRDCK